MGPGQGGCRRKHKRLGLYEGANYPMDCFVKINEERFRKFKEIFFSFITIIIKSLFLY